MPESRVYAPVGAGRRVRPRDHRRARLRPRGRQRAAVRAQLRGRCRRSRFPTPYREVSGKRALVMERFVGERIDQFVADRRLEHRARRRATRAARDRQDDLRATASSTPIRTPATSSCSARPTTPVIGLIDLGLVGRLSEELRDKAIAPDARGATNDADGARRRAARDGQAARPRRRDARSAPRSRRSPRSTSGARSRRSRCRR